MKIPTVIKTFLAGVLLAVAAAPSGRAQLTTGWTEVPYQFIIQSPYTLPMWDRYDYDPIAKTHTFTVRSGDSYHFPQSQASGPRTEMKIVGYNYRNFGSHQLEADFNVSPGTDATCVMQIKGGEGGNSGSATNTFLMLRIYGNNLCNYQSPIMAITKGQWYHLNVIHDAENGPIRVYVDGALKLTVSSNSVADDDHYMKVGVYNQSGAASVNQIKYRNLKMWEKYDSNRQMQTITFPPLPASLAVGSPDYFLGATSSSGLPIRYLTCYEPVATFTTDGKVHVVRDGYADINASQPGNSSYNMATNVMQYLICTTSSKQNQTITCPTIPNKAVGDPDFSLGATASSGSFLKVYSSNRAVATVIKDNKIHVEGPGTTTLTILQIGNSNYNPAVIYRTLTVGTTSAAAAPTFSPGSGTYTTAQSVTISSTTPGASIRYTTDGSTPTSTTGTVYSGPVAIGTTTTLKAIAFASGYSDSPVSTATYTLQLSQTITFPPLPAMAVGATDSDPGATASSGLPVSYTSSNTAVATIVNNKIHVVGAGTATITASQGGNATYTPAPNVTQTLTVNGTSVTYYKLKVANNPSYVLNVSATPANGVNVNVYSYNGGDNQLWNMVDVGSGYLKIVPRSNQSYCLDCSTTPANGINVQVWTYNGNTRQQWLKTDLGNGAFKITVRANATYALDCSTTPANGTNVQVWTYNGNDRQQWILEPVSKPQ